MKLITLIFVLAIGTVMFAQTKESNCCSDKESGITKKMCEVPETTSQVEAKKEVTTTSTAPATTVNVTKPVEVKKEVGKQVTVLVDEQKKKDCCTVDKSEKVEGKEKD
jgi:flagellar biosynthesis component FlhA